MVILRGVHRSTRTTSRILLCMLFLGSVIALDGAIKEAEPSLGSIQFTDIAKASGVHFVLENSPTPDKHQPETMVAGVGLLDYDNDGYTDIFLVNGAEMPSLIKTGPKYYNRLFHNNHDGTFSDVTERAGVKGNGYGMGVAVGDYDNDGWPDLYVVNVNGNQLLHNNGDGTFSDATAKAGVGGASYDGKKMWSISAGWFDYNGDGLLDLFVSNYVQWDAQREPVCQGTAGQRDYCHPGNFAPLPNTLYRNNGDGTFTDVSAETGISKVLGKGMGVAFADYDGDGFPDVFAANDNSPNLLFHNLRGKSFEEVAVNAGVAYDEDGKALAGMGAEFRDTDNDGLPDIWHTAIQNETFPLFRNEGHGSFANATQSSGLGRLSRQMSGWSNGVVDLDNDGWKDLVVARGNVLDDVEKYAARFHYSEPNAVFRNLGSGRFEDVSAGAGADFIRPAPNRGLAYADLDNDGRVDLVITALGQPVKVFHNVANNSNHWIILKLEGTRSNRMGIGAEVRITTNDGKKQYDTVTTSTGYACSSDVRVHFGLGSSTMLKTIEVLWPSGRKQTLDHVAVDRVLQIQEPRGDAGEASHGNNSRTPAQ